VSPTPVCVPGLRLVAAELALVQNFLLVRLQLDDIAPHLPLTGLEACMSMCRWAERTMDRSRCLVQR
jgi:hypothetical protein